MLLQYDPVNDSDFEDDIQEQIAEQYSYAVNQGGAEPEERFDQRRMKRMSAFDRQFSLI